MEKQTEARSGSPFPTDSLMLIVIFCTILLVQLPYFLGQLSTPGDLVYTHLIMNPEDAHTYWAKMVQGYAGAWQYTIPFTAVSHPPAFVGGFYLTLGHIARAAGLSLSSIWHLSRIAANLFLFATIWLFINHFLPHGRGRRTAFVLVLFGSGVGWLLFVLGQPYWLGAFPVDFKQPGAHIFFTALTFPHISAGTALILLSVLGLKAVGEETPNHLHWIMLTGFGNVLLGIAYPFLLYIVIGTAVLYWLALSWRARRPLWRTGLVMNVQFIIPAPLYIYYAWVRQTNAVFRSWDLQAGTPSPPWPHYLIAFGPYLLLLAWPWLRRRGADFRFPGVDRTILYCWIGAVALLLYAPLNPQRRFVQGVHVPLALLAADSFANQLLPVWRARPWWRRLVARPRYNNRALSRFVTFFFVLLMSVGNIYLFLDVTSTAVLVQPDPLFRTADEFAALAWVADNSPPDALFLAEYQSGNLIAGRTSRRVVWGHWAETVEEADQAAAVRTFFAAETSDAWRKTFLAANQVDFLWYGPRERANTGFSPSAADYLEPVYAGNSLNIYRFRP